MKQCLVVIIRTLLFFKAGEVLTFPRAVETWVYDMSGGKPE